MFVLASVYLPRPNYVVIPILLESLGRLWPSGFLPILRPTLLSDWQTFMFSLRIFLTILELKMSPELTR